MSQKYKKKDLIRSNRDIQESLFIRITELNLTLAQIEQDAIAMARPTIKVSRLSAYFRNNEQGKQPSGGLTQEDVLWLCERYGIDVKINVVLKAYNERTFKQNITRKYGKAESVHNG